MHDNQINLVSYLADADLSKLVVILLVVDRCQGWSAEDLCGFLESDFVFLKVALVLVIVPLEIHIAVTARLVVNRTTPLCANEP